MKESFYYAALVTNDDFCKCLGGAVCSSYFCRRVGPFANEADAVAACRVAYRERGELDRIAVVEICDGEFVRATFQ